MAGHSSDIDADSCTDWSGLETRLESFRHFPSVAQVSAERLARAGFYFTGEADRVRCFSCCQTVEGWRSGDAPVDRHRHVSPSCKYLSCVHGVPPASPIDYSTTYDEEAEDMEYRLRRGEVVDNTMYPVISHMRSEDDRLRSFEGWPNSAPVTPRALAQAGFFYLGMEDRVQCFCCGGMLSQWSSGDEPWDEHEKYFHNCFFILGHDVGNVPSSLPPEEPREQQPSMGSFEERLRSFAGVSHPIAPERLARAGLYSSGSRDHVVCFACGGGLKNWQPEEDPWEEHAKHYPGCSFLLEEKGRDFVNRIQLGDPRGSSSTPSHQNGIPAPERDCNDLQLKIAQKAEEMGLDPVKVKMIIQEKIMKTGKGYATVEAFVEDAMRAPTEEAANYKDEDPLEKLRKLQREKQCKVCMDRDIAIVFVPCGHLATCKSCSEALTKCPICCTAITQKIKTYIS